MRRCEWYTGMEGTVGKELLELDGTRKGIHLPRHAIDGVHETDSFLHPETGIDSRSIGAIV